MTGPGSGDGFQAFVNNALPVAVAGDFAGANIKANVVAGSQGFTAVPGGVIVGNGGWANPATKQVSNYYQPNSFVGIVHRAGQVVITQFLGVASLAILSGQAVTLMGLGDFWGLFTAGATPGQKVYVDPSTGAFSGGATGASVGGAITSASIAAGTPAVLTVVTITGTPLAVGQTVSGPGVPPGTVIASLGTGAGGAGTYNLSNLDGTPIPTVAAEAMTYGGAQETPWIVASVVNPDAVVTASLAPPAAPALDGILTVTAVTSGTLAPGQWISAAGLPGSVNVQILEQLTSTAAGGALGSTGTYLVSNPSYTIASTAFTATQGKLGKITNLASI